ncbi:aspartic proteinase nepenthesin-1-like [Triticum dicoccoides]|uniref:aspartic proteinase nepenthesin-1-like n=1 Tax=Triticum dicoccoides TaxID=85692 RepID=UPI0018903A93|nr:aspartic proteinase nepenthesin-1-like [Triticum dicoccoides]
MMKDMIALQLLPCVLFLTVLLAMSATSHAAALRLDLTHVDSGRGFTKGELLRRMAARSRARIDSRWSPPGRGANAHAVTAPVARGTVGKEDFNSEYLIHFSIGTPRPQRVALTLDTGSDLVWTQCFCQVCFPQPFPELDTSASGTARGVSCFDPLCAQGSFSLSGCAVGDNSCMYTDSYGDNSVTTGKLYEDTFTFQQAPNGKAAVVPNLRFGCGMFNTGIFGSNESGIAGFGRGALSLPSQLKVGKFSHCFTTIVESRPSPAFLGTPDNLQAQATGRLQSTPLVRNPESNHYYLSLKGITVGKTRLPFDASAFALKGDGSGGTIIDSGSALTSVPEAVYRSLVEAFESQVPLPVNKNNTDEHEGLLCFTASPKKKEIAMPKLILHLEGADWDLPRENYVLYTEEDGLCVVIGSAGEDNRSLIGNFQQQNTHIVYDLEHNMLVFVPARCDKL